MSILTARGMKGIWVIAFIAILLIVLVGIYYGLDPEKKKPG